MKVYLVTGMNKYNKLCFSQEYYTEESANQGIQELKNLGLIAVMHTEYIDIEPTYTEEFKYAN